MTDTAGPLHSTEPPKTAQDWVRVLARYREPRLRRSLFELGISLAAFVALWALAWWALSFSGWLAAAIAVVNAGFLLRLFIIQHDCGHGSFFHNRTVSDWVGRALGVLTLTPYDVWRRTHAIHHAHSGNLDKRGIGDIHTLTLAEYAALPWHQRVIYRLYRNPAVLFVLGPIYVFGLQNRLPVGLMRAGPRYWISAMGTNAAIALALGLIVWLGGLKPLLLIFAPTAMVAAAAGIWLFFVQHQFEDTHWRTDGDWQVHEAAFKGSSHYVMPGWLRWITGNIGIHHVHHLYARIPFYRLTEVLRDHRVLAEAQRLTLRQSLACARLHLWDENTKRLLSFAEARALGHRTR